MLTIIWCCSAESLINECIWTLFFAVPDVFSCMSQLVSCWNWNKLCCGMESVLFSLIGIARESKSFNEGSFEKSRDQLSQLLVIESTSNSQFMLANVEEIRFLQLLLLMAEWSYSLSCSKITWFSILARWIKEGYFAQIGTTSLWSKTDPPYCWFLWIFSSKQVWYFSSCLALITSLLFLC